MWCLVCRSHFVHHTLWISAFLWRDQQRDSWTSEKGKTWFYWSRMERQVSPGFRPYQEDGDRVGESFVCAGSAGTQMDESCYYSQRQDHCELRNYQASIKSIYKSLAKISNLSKLNQMILIYLARQMNESEIMQAQIAFNSIDKAGSGLISLQEFIDCKWSWL